ncbi:MAG TPA: TolC family protein [Candidatus Kapabacteria bacterium]|nr:TolC family protein [Candidatus Kapabacteria bacterium]
MTLSHRTFKRISITLAYVVIYVLCAGDSLAQQRVQLSLDQALDRVSEQNEELRVALAGLRRAEANERVANSGYWPQISASATYSKTLISQFESAGNNAQQDQPADTSQQPGFDFSSLIGDLPFGREDVWTLGINASQAIYMGGRLHAQSRAAETRVESSRIEITAQQAQMLLNVTQSYYDALLADQLVGIARASITQANEALKDIELAFKVGQRPEYDVLRARVSRDNQIPTLVERENQRQLSHLRLKQLLNLPMQDTLILTGSVRDSSDRFAVVADSAADERAPVQQSALTIEASRAQVDIAASEGLPAVSISSRYAPTAYEMFPGFDDWRTDWTVSLNASIPIFTGGRISGSVAAAEASVEEAEARLAQAKEAASLDAKATYNEYEQAIAALRAAEGAGDLAERTVTLAQLRYKEGISTQLEVTDARLQRDIALSNEARAYRNYQVARAKLSLLNRLPLGGSAAGLGGTSSAASQAAQLQSAGQTTFSTPSPQSGASQSGGATMGGFGQ